MKFFTLSLFLVAVSADDYDAPRGRSQRTCVFPIIPPNLSVRPQGKGRIMRFTCPPGGVLVGKRYSTCLRGRWTSPPPICVSKGCPPQPVPTNGRISESYDGGVLTFGCNPGYTQNGSSTIYCVLPQWNGTAPTCTAPLINPNVSCDFEDPDLCGWSHDVTHDFEWKRNKFSTPSGHVGTGPSFDHTLGKGLDGHYVYLEASAPQKPGDINRLFSPVYPTVLSNSCFKFWYHMYGSSIGSLRVYLKEENQILAELTPAWNKDHETGNYWLQGQIDVPQLTTNFQLVIEGVRGADYMGDIAIDDVSLGPGTCPDQENQGNMTSATTTDEGGGPGVTASQNSTQSTTAAYTREVTTNQPVTTVTKEPSVAETTPPNTSGTISTVTSTASSTNKLVTSTPSTSRIEFTSAKTETTPPAQPKQTDCVIIDTKNLTQDIDPNWVFSLSNCSTIPQISVPKTTVVDKSSEVPTIDYRSTTILPTAVTTTTSTPESLSTTQRNTYITSTTLQPPTTISSTTKSRFIIPKSTKQIPTTTTSSPTVNTTLQSTTNTESGKTKRIPFIPKTTATTTTTTTTTTSTTSVPTTSSVVYTSPTPQTTVSTTIATTTPMLVPDSSNLTATTIPSVTTTKVTSSPSITTTTTRKPFIYIVPKTARTVTINPLSTTTQTEESKGTSTLSTNATEASTQSSTSTKQSSSFVPQKQVTTPTSTTDIRSLFPDSSEEDSDEDDDDHSGQNDGVAVDTVPGTESENSARWDEFPRRPHPREKQPSGTGVSALATACSLGALVLVVSVFTIIYFVRRRKLKQQRFGSNSEMRYITQSEELQLSSPDNSDMIKLL